MSLINLQIPGEETKLLQEELDVILNGKSPTISDGDTLNLNYKVDFPSFDNLADRLRALAKICENDSVIISYNVDVFALSELRECLALLDFVQQKSQQHAFDDLITRVNIFNADEEKAA